MEEYDIIHSTNVNNREVIVDGIKYIKKYGSNCKRCDLWNLCEELGLPCENGYWRRSNG